MEELYTVNEAAAAIKVHPLTIRRYINQSKLVAYRVGGNIRISPNDLRSFTQNFIPHQKSIKSQLSTQAKPFSLEDPIFRLKGKGINMARPE